MATYNGSRYIRASINSILSQTYRDLELIVGDDGSTDDTLDILARYDDPRLKVIRNETNLGVVGTRNRCLEAASGTFVAMLDHDDISRPRRIEKEVAYLEAHPDTALVGTAAHLLEKGELSRTSHPTASTPGLIHWLLQVANPIICSSVMFRAETARRLDVFMREAYKYADDYDLYHRLSAHGAIARLDEPLTIYRLHASNTFRQHEDVMSGNAIKVLTPAYAGLFGSEAPEAAALVVHHLSAGRPVPDDATLRRLSGIFDTLNRSVLDDPATDDQTRRLLRRHSAQLWRRVLASSARMGTISGTAMEQAEPAGFKATAGDKARLLLAPLRIQGGRVRNWLRRDVAPTPAVPTQLFDTVYEPCLPDPLQPATLFVVVDTEAEFDWNAPFARDLTGVRAMDDVMRGQDIFDTYGLRPIYVVDYPIASQPRGYETLRAIAARDGCEIGAHLHPWTNPPFKEEVSVQNSYPGNLLPEIEAEKLADLVGMIRATFGKAPVFYKAGRYGFGPRTAETLRRNGFKVDLSVLPGADLRASGGPDFSGLQSIPYRIAETGILTLPMTRSHVGFSPSIARLLGSVRTAPAGAKLHVPAVLARLRIADTITLTPEGVTTSEQIRLLRFLMGQGFRQFVLHYHSPSLSPGHTPYVRDQADLQALLGRIRAVCEFFFEEAGGLPGYPKDLLQVLD